VLGFIHLFVPLKEKEWKKEGGRKHKIVRSQNLIDEPNAEDGDRGNTGGRRKGGKKEKTESGQEILIH